MNAKKNAITRQGTTLALAPKDTKEMEEKMDKDAVLINNMSFKLLLVSIKITRLYLQSVVERGI